MEALDETVGELTRVETRVREIKLAVLFLLTPSPHNLWLGFRNQMTFEIPPTSNNL